MFNYSEKIYVSKSVLESMIEKIVNKRIKNLKVQIPTEQINNAVVKFFTEKKWFLTENGKKLDTFDLIRKFAMNTIGVAENGELNPEFLKIVREEIAKMIGDKAITETIENDTHKECTCGKCNCDSESTDDEIIDESSKGDENFDDIDEDISYETGYTDGYLCAVEAINEIVKKRFPDKQFEFHVNLNTFAIEIKSFKDEQKKTLTAEETELVKQVKSMLETLGIS